MKGKPSPFQGHQVRIALVRETSKSMLPSTYVKTPEDAAELMKELKEKDREHFAVILLNTKNRVLGVEVVSIGTLDASLVSPREVLKSALLANAAALVCVHNHPSGDPSPSAEDIRITKTLKQAAKIMDINILDHVIIGDTEHVSLRELGIL